MELIENRPSLQLWMTLTLVGVTAGLAIPLVTWLGLWTGALIVAVLLAALVVMVCADSIDIFSPALLFTIIWILCAIIGAQIVSIQQRPWNTPSGCA